MIYRKFLLSGLFLSILLGITSININEAQAKNVTFDFDSLPFAQDWIYIGNETSIPETNLFLVSDTTPEADGEPEVIDFLTIFGAVGTVVTILAFVWAFWESYQRRKLEKEQQEQVLLTIHFANYVSFEHKFIDEICPIIKDTIINRYLVSWHQKGCDLYEIQVRYYLSLLNKFTYEDLENLCNTPIISSQWQEKHWRYLVSQRKENKGKSLPTEFWVKEKDSHPRLTYYRKHKNDTRIRSLTMESDEVKSQLVEEIKKKHPEFTDNEAEAMLSDNYFGSFDDEMDFVDNYLIEILTITNYHTFRDCIDHQKIWEKMENKVIQFRDGHKRHMIIDDIT